ncbi:flagellar motor protein MotB [Novosphingobium sp.]|jgi:chemotaxis protein MotB|uniref:flagellar motor protein MotB n=1 Tax=Novosphingobium sp. TaxID=1874826 RepID=UPI001EBC626C|nr:flagellar motor protein MotB [Novosphingobium sp.]MBK6801906.1 OmpA family protein [Novosphingobium sp.]MBK9010253.1 OmpA family protein [Novosphingobium sp.]
MAAKPAARGKNEPPRPIIVKKITVVEGGHHGGAWKVAYADFVTAMMAFFLLLWLLGATTEKQRKGLADYFTPTLVKLKQESAGSNGMLGGSSITDVDNYPNRAGQTGNKAMTIPLDTTGGPKEGAQRAKRVESMQKRLEAKLAQNQRIARLSRQVRMVDTAQGIRIDLVDDADFSMFQLGTTVLTGDAAELLRVLGQVVSGEPGELTVRGHTDALPWKGGLGANNWSLSAGRAEATRQALLRQGVAEDRFRRIEGVADREPLVRDNPQDPRNRRISILLLR